jgi:hypothetical protein
MSKITMKPAYCVNPDSKSDALGRMSFNSSSEVGSQALKQADHAGVPGSHTRKGPASEQFYAAALATGATASALSYCSVMLGMHSAFRPLAKAMPASAILLLASLSKTDCWANAGRRIWKGAQS